MTLAANRSRNKHADMAHGSVLILLTMSLGVLIAQIDTSVVNLATHAIGATFHASVGSLQWVLDAYNLVYAALLLTGGLIADLYGRRRAFQTGAAILKMDAASGRTNPTTGAGMSSSSALRTTDGSVAIDELELNAMSCEGKSARA